MVKDCKSEEDYQQLLADSKDKVVFLFKHSTACPVSRGTWQKFTAFSEEDERADYWRILVREEKTLSARVAEETGIEHKSPQVILFRKGKAIWNCSHYAINERNLGRQLKDIEVK